MTCGSSSIVIDGEEEREDFKAMELYLESPLNVDVDIMPPSEAEKLFRAFAEERKRALPQFTPDGIPITLENKFDDAIYNYLYEYWKTNSGEYDPKDDEIIMTKENSFTKNEKKFEQWLLQQYGMTKKEEREYTVKGNLLSLGEIGLSAWGIASAGATKLVVPGKFLASNADDTAKKALQQDTIEDAVEGTLKKEVGDTTEDLSQKIVDKEDILKNSSAITARNKIEIKEVIPPGSTHSVKVYTDGFAQINKGKIDIYIRGKVKLDVEETMNRIDELKNIRKLSPENFTKSMKKELQECEDKLHNYQRSQEMSKTLNEAGIEDTIENNQMIVENLVAAAKKVTQGNTEIISYIDGVNGKVQVVSRWKILSDGNPYLATVILKPVK